MSNFVEAHLKQYREALLAEGDACLKWGEVYAAWAQARADELTRLDQPWAARRSSVPHELALSKAADACDRTKARSDAARRAWLQSVMDADVPTL